MALRAGTTATQVGHDQVLALALEALLVAREGHHELDQRLAAADQLVDLGGDDIQRGRCHLYRARLKLAAGDRPGLDQDLAMCIAVTTDTGDTRCQGRAEQLCATLAMVDGNDQRAAEFIERAATRLAQWPVEQEIAFVQRWWLSLTSDHEALISWAHFVSDFELHPANRILVGFTFAFLDDLSRAEREYSSAWDPDTNELTVPRDSTFPVAVVGALQVALALGDSARARTCLRHLRRYSGQIILAGDGFFTPGSADRFISIAEHHLGMPPTSGASAMSEPEAELRVGGPAFAMQCRDRVLPSLRLDPGL